MLLIYLKNVFIWSDTISNVLKKDQQYNIEIKHWCIKIINTTNKTNEREAKIMTIMNNDSETKCLLMKKKSN